MFFYDNINVKENAVFFQSASWKRHCATHWREQRGWDLVIFDWFVLSMRMQVILDSSFARPGSAPIWGGKKGEFRDWTNKFQDTVPKEAENQVDSIASLELNYKTRAFDRKFEIKPIPISLTSNNDFWYCCPFSRGISCTIPPAML